MFENTQEEEEIDYETEEDDTIEPNVDPETGEILDEDGLNDNDITLF